jgi:hypothetical protein
VGVENTSNAKGPAWNTVMEYECWQMSPPGVSIHSSRIAHTGDNEEALLRMAAMGPEAARLLENLPPFSPLIMLTGWPKMQMSKERRRSLSVVPISDLLKSSGNSKKNLGNLSFPTS